MTISALITGATGFIGRRLAPRLAAEGFAVTSLQRSDEMIPGVSETIRLSPFSPGVILDALKSRRFDCLFHLASYGVNPRDRNIADMFDMNVNVTRALVEIASRWPAKSVVISGSGAEYDLAGATVPIPEHHPLETFKSYGASKAAGGLLALAIARANQLPLAYGRLFGAFGPGEAPHRLLPTLVSHLSGNKRAPLSYGQQVRDLLYVDDVVSAFIALTRFLFRSPGQFAINICSGEPLTVRSFVEQVADCMSAPRELLGFGDVAMRPDDEMFFCGNPNLLHNLVDWRPSYTLARGIRAALQERGHG